MRVEPKVVGTIKGQGDTEDRSGLMVPVVISGTFAEPKFRPDLKSAVTQDIKGMLKDDDPESVTEKAKGLIKGLLGD